MMKHLAGVLFACFLVLFASRVARAGENDLSECKGPPECCIKDRSKVTVPLPEPVHLGVRLMRLSAISERDGNYSADLYILRRWPAGGLRPGLELRNVVDDANIVEERTDVDGGFCYHAIRFQDDFDTAFLLRRFPFDRQKLKLILEDPNWEPELFQYSDDLWPVSISDDAFRDMQAWRFESYPTVHQKDAKFRYHPHDTPSRLLIVDIPVAREWKFFISRYFLPLILIVSLSYALFFIAADDLASSSSIGVTAVLAIIAFQITQSDTLPKVGYLTLADRVYTICYIFTGAALALVIAGAWFTRHGKADRADRIYKRCRVYFPILFVLTFGGSAVWGWMSGKGETDMPEDIPAAPVPPAGEEVY
jgi:hypothetical protein